MSLSYYYAQRAIPSELGKMGVTIGILAVSGSRGYIDHCIYCLQSPPFFKSDGHPVSGYRCFMDHVAYCLQALPHLPFKEFEGWPVPIYRA